MNRSSAVFGRPASPLSSPSTHDSAELDEAALPSHVDEGPTAAAAQPPHAGMVLREWLDALVIAIVLAMFIRVFMVELFKIPTGSMTPTLIGGQVVDTDYNGDGKMDLLLLRDSAPPLLFLNDGRRLLGAGEVDLSWSEVQRLGRSSRIQNDRILVNKFAYWFHPPRRGDVVVFKVPDRIWDPRKPIYIKRCVGEPGERLSFDASGHLQVGGRRVENPLFFRAQTYDTVVGGGDFHERPEVSYLEDPFGNHRIEAIHVPRHEIYVFGDNTHSSLDSRYWGGVPLVNVKGRAFFRFWPLGQLRFLRNEASPGGPEGE